jgi:hypothetical protein
MKKLLKNILFFIFSLNILFKNDGYEFKKTLKECIQ